MYSRRCCWCRRVVALAADIPLVGPRAKFGFIFPQVGLCGADMGAAYLLPKVVGLGHASELLYTGDIIGAERAIEIGLANHLISDEGQLIEEGTRLAARIAAGPYFANQLTKQMLEDEMNLGLSEAIEAEAQAQAICMQHPDFREAYDAWVEKRAARYEGLES